MLIARLASAAYNIIHDCDEVFNYWEPLHYLLYGYGLQTWEYSAEFALRSWWYLLLHAAVGGPAAWLFGEQKGKLAVFYLIRAAFAGASALTEWWLYRAVKSRYSATVTNAFLALLVASSGLFAASAAFLPSSFTMCALTAAAASLISGNYPAVIFSAVIGVFWGWCVAGLAFIPYALWVLGTAPLFPAFGILLAALVSTLAPLVVADRFFYGNWKASLWNFLVYNVAGGGKSALYGVEGPLYYLRNGLNQLQLVLPLSLLLPAAALLALAAAPGNGARRRLDGTLLIAIAPLFTWLAAITVLPHKEERFLFVVYPLACLAAAATLDALSRVSTRVFIGPSGTVLAKSAVGAAVVLTSLLSLSRTVALVTHYGAPLEVYRALPAVVSSEGAPQQAEQVNVCVGAEWYRFPSSFFLPGPSHRIQFIKSGFNGLLPRHFETAAGGTRAAPPQLNDDNREEPENYWNSAEKCDYAVTLKDGENWIDREVLGSPENWETVVEENFLDASKSPALTRAFYIPKLSAEKNTWMKYVLLKRRSSGGKGETA